jgi:redox-sensitive bicupin YhaK (pirin superfamily)
MSRNIDLRVRGTQHGFIRRMVSPGDVGERIKPFVFLDYVNGRVQPGAGFGFHPHSGIATLTYALDTDVAYEDTTGQKGIVEATGLEWMRAGGGTWHQGFIHPRGETVESFQLWLALPPGVEDGPSEGLYVAPDRVPQVGNVRVLLGDFGGVTHPIPTEGVAYLDVVLEADERWSFAPAPGQTVAWAFVYRGRVRVADELVREELVVFDPSDAAIELQAVGPARVLFGCARPHEHPLVLGSHSVHTNPRSLANGVAKIREIGADLRRRGVI